MPLRLLISSYILTATLPWVLPLVGRMAPGHMAVFFGE